MTVSYTHLDQISACPVCGAPSSMFQLIEEEGNEPAVSAAVEEKAGEDSLAYEEKLVRHDKSCRYMEEIHQMAVSGKTVSASMATELKMPSWDDILILGAQLDPMPLDEDAPVSTRTIIGKKEARPLVLDNPVFVSHMSFGALSKEAKISLAKGTAMAKSAMCSGEGGILPEEMAAADKYIFE